MNYIIREIKEEEYPILSDFLYEAIFIPESMEKPPKAIIEQSELQVYIADFGKEDDWCLVAEVKGKIVGAVWGRIMNDYGHIDDETPSLAISLYGEGIFYAEFDMEAIREYRNREMLGNTFRKVESYSRLLSKEIKEPFIRDGQNR